MDVDKVKELEDKVLAEQQKRALAFRKKAEKPNLEQFFREYIKKHVYLSEAKI